MQNPPASSASAQQPLISFIVTYYNLPPQLLGACIDSILALSLTPEEREIIVIDDGSEESPLETLREKWNDILYIRQQNQGLSAARNLGIEACRGTFIQFVDGDDLLNTSIYEQCLDILRQKDPDIVAFHLSDKEERNMTVEYEGPMEGSEYMRHNNLRASACGYIFRKKTLVNLRFTSGILHEDE
jgi:glycosyltransferase involved in cell wall biosynthesis